MTEHDPYSRVEYRKLIAWPERIRREWPLIEEVFASAPSKHLLEVGCGPGQHARALADAGYSVVGLDRSPAMIEAATEEPLPEGLELVLGDMRELETLADLPGPNGAEGRSFGGALCLGNSLPHLAEEGDLRAFARGLGAVLEPGAPALIQILNYDRIHEKNIRSLPINFRPGPDGGREEAETVFVRLMTPLPDGRVRFYPSTLTLHPGEDPPLRLERSREVLLRGWRRHELETALTDAGLPTERALGGFDAEDFDPLESHDLVLVARREG
jgi:SAM-dependent methyltransferase